MDVANTTELNTYLDTVANFGDYLRLEVDKDYSPQTIKDYMGQMKTIQKLLKVDSLSASWFNSFDLVINSLEKMYDDKKMGLSSYKKKLDVLVKINEFYAIKIHDHYRPLLREELIKDTSFGRCLSKYQDIRNKEFTLLYKLSNFADYLKDELKKAWEKLTVIQSNPQANKKQKARQFHDLETIRKKWMELYRNVYMDDMKHIREFAEKPSIHSFPDMVKLQKNGKFVRLSHWMEYEAFLTYGLYIWAPPRRAKDYMSMVHYETIEDIEDNVDNYFLIQPTSDVVVYNNYKTNKIYGRQCFVRGEENTDIFFHNTRYWKCLEDLRNLAIVRDRHMKYLQKNEIKDIKLPFEKNLLMETNLGHRLRSWSAEHLFDGDMSKATSINDLRHIFINNFYKTEQSDEDRKLLSEFMSHSVKTQSYYKKDDVSGEVN